MHGGGRGLHTTQTVTRVVNLHVTASCPIPGGSLGDYVATGDYPPVQPNLTRRRSPRMWRARPSTACPANVQSLALLATPAGRVELARRHARTANRRPRHAASARGVGVRAQHRVGFVDGMMFGAGRCAHARRERRRGERDAPSYRVDLDTGRIDADEHRPASSAAAQRVRAVRRRGQAIVAGGVTVSTPILRGDVEVYDPASSDFDPTVDHHRAALRLRRRHARDRRRAPRRRPRRQRPRAGLRASRLRSRRRRSGWRAAPVCPSSTARPETTRTSPYALRISDGNILVGGGFDASGIALATSTSSPPTRRRRSPSRPCPARSKHAFVALDGGGALFVRRPRPAAITRLSARVDRERQPDRDRADVTARSTDVKLFPRAGGGALLWTGRRGSRSIRGTAFAPLANAPHDGAAT